MYNNPMIPMFAVGGHAGTVLAAEMKVRREGGM